RIGERLGGREPAAVRPDADEVRVAERADRARTVLLAPRPQVAPREPAEDRGAAHVRALALQRVEDLLDRVTHAYRIGSVAPASANPLRRSWHASQWPQAAPSGVGS